MTPVFPVNVRMAQEIAGCDTFDRPGIRSCYAELKDEGRVLIRYSGTQNMCRVMVEGPTPEVTQEHCRQLADGVKKALG